MRPWLTINEFLNKYQQKLKPGPSSRPLGLDREIRLSCQAADTFDAADYFKVIRTPGIAEVGFQESRYINRLDAESRDSLSNTLRREPVGAIIRSLAGPVEVAAGNHLLQTSGYNSARDFIRRQNQAIARDEQTAG